LLTPIWAGRVVQWPAWWRRYGRQNIAGCWTGSLTPPFCRVRSAAATASCSTHRPPGRSPTTTVRGSRSRRRVAGAARRCCNARAGTTRSRGASMPPGWLLAVYTEAPTLAGSPVPRQGQAAKPPRHQAREPAGQTWRAPVTLAVPDLPDRSVVPTLCPQSQITTVSCSDVVSHFRYPIAVSTSASKRLYTPAVGGSIPSAPTSSPTVAGQL
jgi:hypothetical protein